MKREEIMANCPEEFEDKLKKFIDAVELQVCQARDLLDVRNIDDIDNVSSAFHVVDNLAGDLY